MIELNKVQNIKIILENIETTGKITEIDNLGKIFTEIPKEHHCLPAEINKRGILSFVYNGKNYIMGGKFHCQNPHKVVFTPETDIEEEKREEVRVETPAIPVELSFKSGLFHTETIRGEILDLSVKGASIETFCALKKDITYSLSCDLPYRHKKLSFSSKCILKNIRRYRTAFINGVEFTQIDPSSLDNLRKYISHIRGLSKKDALNP